MEYLNRCHRFLGEKISRAIVAIDAHLQDPATPEFDLCASLDLVLDKQIELRALDAAVRENQTGDELKNDVPAALHFDDEIHFIRTRLLRHPAGRAAMDLIPETLRSDRLIANGHRMNVPAGARGTHFSAHPPECPDGDAPGT